VKLPELGEGVTEGELVKWLIKAGDLIKPDQSIAEIMTDKATVEVPSPIAGVVEKLLFKEGETIKVESDLIVLKAVDSNQNLNPAPLNKVNSNVTSVDREQDSSIPSSMPMATLQAVNFPQKLTNSINSPQFATEPMSQSERHDVVLAPADTKVLATPSTRRLARELNIDINLIQGTGLAGRVTREDVLNYTKGLHKLTKADGEKFSLVTHRSAEERVPLKGIRKKIAENMQMSKRVIPHFTLMDEAVVTELVKVRESLKELAESHHTKITYLPFVMKALVATAKEFPMFNASIDDQQQEIVYKKYFHLGFAADTPNGLVVPVVHDVDQKSILMLAKEILELSHRAREGKLKLEEMKGATMTITNIGAVGGTYATPIINHPEVAILGMYKLMDKVVVGDHGQFVVEKVMNFTITCDHRLIDGAVAARFLKSFIARIGQPSRLLVEMI